MNSTKEDINEILRLYEIARNFQKTKNAVLWPLFEKELIETEVAEKSQWKIVIDNQIACAWATTFNDPQIWEERNNDPSIYIHRIVTNPTYRGKNLVDEIGKWSKTFAKQNDQKFIPMDTVGENKGLIEYYQKCGFEFLGILKLKNTDGLPTHYEKATVSLFQITLD